MICDRVAILANGKVLRTAAVSEVLYGSVTSYEILATNAPRDLVKKISLGKTSTRGDKTVIALPPEYDLNTSLKQLIALGVRIESVNPLRQTLEDYFVRELKEQGRPPGGGRGSERTFLARSSKENGV
jgi:ABC-type multidrug transport system ATPase subunit